jgi:putative acyl-CoA dehydrogenase
MLAQTDEGGRPASAARPVLLLRAALPAGRQPQRDPRAAPEEQAGQPLERLVRGRVLRRRRLDDRPAGRGIPTILEMGSHTRLDCVVGTAGIMRAALCHALHHARGRSAFGRPLAEQPLMQNVLADLALESEAATAFALRLARCFDRDPDDPLEALLGRILTPAGKYWLCKRGPAFGAEAMEVMGGNGYVEDGPLARLYREFPVNSIWEGSGNVMCLDVLRALGKGPGAARARWRRSWRRRPACDPRFDAYARACWTP